HAGGLSSTRPDADRIAARCINSRRVTLLSQARAPKTLSEPILGRFSSIGLMPRVLISAHHEFGASEDQRRAQLGGRRFDRRAGRRRKGTTQRPCEHGRIRRWHQAWLLRSVVDFDAARPAVSRNHRAYRPALARFIFLERGSSER